MADLHAKAVLSAEDRASAVLAMVARNFDKLNSAATRMHQIDARKGQIDAYTSALSRRGQVLENLKSSMAAGIAYRFAPAAVTAATFAATTRATRAYAEQERAMTRTAITGDATRDQQEAAFRSMERIAHETAVPVKSVHQGLDALVSAGRSLPEAMQFLPSVVRTAQAAGAEVVDIAKSADAVGNAMKISGGEMQHAFDLMVAGGKEGKFELKDMARYLPELAPAAAAMGLQGTEGLKKLVAMLQIVRNQTGSAEEAASSMKNIFAKYDSDETRKKFKEFGIDLEKEYAKAKTEGKDLIQVLSDLTNKATKGDMSKIPRLFADMELSRGMRALSGQTGELSAMIGKLGNVSGAVDRDLSRVLKDSQTSMDQLSSSSTRLWNNLGKAVVPTVVPAINAVTQALNNLNEAMEKTEKTKQALEERGYKAPVVPKTPEEVQAERLIDMAKRHNALTPDMLTQYPDGGFHRTRPKPAPVHRLDRDTVRMMDVMGARRRHQDTQSREEKERLEFFKQGERASYGAVDHQKTESGLLSEQKKRLAAVGSGTPEMLQAQIRAADKRIADLSEQWNDPSKRDTGVPGEVENKILRNLETAVRTKMDAQALIDSGGNNKASGHDIQAMLHKIMSGEFKAEVKPDQISAKIEGRVETSHSIKVEASPDFITRIVSQVTRQIGPVFGSAGNPEGMVAP